MNRGSFEIAGFRPGDGLHLVEVNLDGTAMLWLVVPAVEVGVVVVFNLIRSKEMKMSLDKAIQTAVTNIPECVAGGYVDMSTGMLLGVKTVESHPQEVLDYVAASTADLFQGQNVTTIENMFKKHRGMEVDDHHYFQEIIVFSDNLLHIFQRCKDNTDHAVVWVCDKSANIGMALTKSRMQLSKVEGAL